MNSAIEIKKNIYWLGVNDRRTHIFENYWPLPKGVAYNSYVILDEKVVVLDTVNVATWTIIWRVLMRFFKDAR